MAQHVLVVCQACGATEEDTPQQETAGMRLLNRLKELHEQWPRKEELVIETTSCLCICERACAIAYVGTHKPTYLFGDLSPECAADLLTAGELYLDSQNGMVSAYKLPNGLQSRRMARIPSAP